MRSSKQEGKSAVEIFASFGGKFVDKLRGFGIRMLVHTVSLAVAGTFALSSSVPACSGLTVAASVYSGLICIFARGISRTPSWLVPAMAGAIQTVTLVFLGFPLYHAIFWGGAQSWLQRLLHKRLQMGVEWLVLPVTLPIAITLADTTPLRLLLPAFTVIGVTAGILLRKLMQRISVNAAPAKRLSAGQQVVALHRASIAALREKSCRLPQDAQKTVTGIAAAAENILQCLLDNTRNVEQGNRFLKRYLTAVHTIADKHARLAREPVITPDIISALTKSDQMLVRLEAAFVKEHSHLLENGATDFSAELRALDTLLKMDGR